jgi:hypothetical protein
MERSMVAALKSATTVKTAVHFGLKFTEDWQQIPIATEFANTVASTD